MKKLIAFLGIFFLLSPLAFGARHHHVAANTYNQADQADAMRDPADQGAGPKAKKHKMYVEKSHQRAQECQCQCHRHKHHHHQGILPGNG